MRCRTYVRPVESMAFLLNNDYRRKINQIKTQLLSSVLWGHQSNLPLLIQYFNPSNSRLNSFLKLMSKEIWAIERPAISVKN